VPIQYKAVAINSFDGSVVWESGNNHELQVPKTQSSKVSNDWRP